MKRHLGKIKNTDQRCVVVFMQIPGRPDHALVVSTDSLSFRNEQALMEIVESQEGQADPVLGNVMHRRFMPDSTVSVLQAFHEANLLRAEPIDNVLMMPRPNMPIPLRKLLEDMGANPPAPTEPSVLAESKFNPHEANMQARSVEERSAIARNLIVEAEMLEAEARAKRAKAAEFVPPAPETKTVTVKTEDLSTVVKKATRKKASPKSNA